MRAVGMIANASATEIEHLRVELRVRWKQGPSGDGAAVARLIGDPDRAAAGLRCRRVGCPGSSGQVAEMGLLVVLAPEGVAGPVLEILDAPVLAGMVGDFGR
ncbi:hypothetical protein [Spirillospora sp. NBC_01491]|uniref:hypothetical protein n=1 Tax=Spirillospora sp. NBC_01491 TaxID=2976007 RepID=UPI002E323C81|nr:hypothetical protein [Spirillospora sp. NBC_01491]